VKVYSNKITEHDVSMAFIDAKYTDGADIYPVDISSFKPRGHEYGVTFYAGSDHGVRLAAHRGDTYEFPRAASWDAWGWVIARLYLLDPDARIGNYRDVSDFIDKVTTSNRMDKEPKDFLSLVTEDEGPGSYQQRMRTHIPGAETTLPGNQASRTHTQMKRNNI
jgi:hypothetical protein